MGWRGRGFSDIGFTLSGRDALYMHGLASADNRVIFLESNMADGLVSNGIFLVPEGDSFVDIDGVRCAPVGKALIDYMMHPYDDSGVIEAAEMLDKHELDQVLEYANKTNNIELLKDKRWYEFFEDAL